ncbi:esterase/lipase family protein [Oceanobacillus saliphilus]|uniref:esterase/lipase family protein n=1 Tax=Oceanobacillus saliphilus TaxID=2925834 RepID=UPI00201E52B2|nr:hypothetical protein [Oceanobacillus saliphilus]
MLCLVALITSGIHSQPHVSATTDAVPIPISIDSSSSSSSTMGKAGNGNEETPGTWYVGATPGNLLPDAPVLLFVPGLNNVAQLFWENNDMYQTAYHAGYQTAFVQLYDAGGESANMWNNGRLLAEKITEISQYFGGKDITIVDYSKGGVDSQAALTYYGASNYVDNVITLSSPHHGSQLADLAYSSGAGWLANLIGMQGEGTYSMQMAYMENFRSQTDENPNAYLNDYFTLGGTDWGSIFSPNWFGGVYLSSYGANDGVVTAASSNLPGGHELAIREWNHTTIRTGATFSFFEDYLAGDNLVAAGDFSVQHVGSAAASSESNQWVHGGPLAKKDLLTVHVEEDVEKLTLNLLTAEKLSTIKVTNPSGKNLKTNVQQVNMEEGIFKGAVSYTVTIDKPEAGEWKLAMQSKTTDNAYLFVADFKTVPYLEKNNVQNFIMQEDIYELEIDAGKFDVDTLSATYHLSESSNPRNAKQWTVKGKSNLSQKLEFDKANVVYNITVDIEGITKEGNIFNRTIVDSVYSK